ncbi:MAG: hypothetical protein ACKOPO_07515 [Novosphingobium sp.]
MSRSYRKTPIHGMTNACSDHPWKRKAARALRRRYRQVLATGAGCEAVSAKRWAIVNPATSAKDGKVWFGKDQPRLLRK